MAGPGLRPAVRRVRTLAVFLAGLIGVGCGGESGGSADDASGRVAAESHDVAGSVDASAESRDATGARSVAYRTQVMGTWGTVTIVTADSAGSAPVAAGALDTWHHVNQLLSNWQETSALSAMNRTAGADTVTVDAELALVLGRALEVAAASDGAFDVTVEPLVRLWGFLGGTPHVPDADDIDALLGRIGWQKVWLGAPAGRVNAPGGGDASGQAADAHGEAPRVAFGHPDLKVDLGGIAKGYGVDLAWEALRAAGVSGMADLSGNIRTLGTPAGRDAWVVGVRDPRGRLPYFAKLRLHEAAMATSGQYEQFVAENGKQYGHILDPRTGWPAEGLLSVTVLAPTAMDADAWATALFVLGPEKAREVAKARADLAVVLVEDGGRSAQAGAQAPGAPTADDAAADGPRDVVWVEAAIADRFQLVEGVTFAEVRTF